MRLLIIILTFIWFTGWGLWFLNARGHVPQIGSKSDLQTNKNITEDKDSLPPTPKSDHHAFSFRQFLSSDSLYDQIDPKLKNRNENEIIHIIAYYSELESYSGKEENLGIARARKITEEFPDTYPAEFLHPIGFLAKGDPDTTGINSYVQIEKADKQSPVHIFEDNRVVIFFPYASSNELARSEERRVGKEERQRRTRARDITTEAGR